MEKVMVLGKSKVALLEEIVISAGFFSTTGEGDSEGVTVGVTDGDGGRVGVGEGAGLAATEEITVGVGVAIGEGAVTEAGGGAVVIEGSDAAVDGPQAASPTAEVSIIKMIIRGIKSLDIIFCLKFGLFI